MNSNLTATNPKCPNSYVDVLLVGILIVITVTIKLAYSISFYRYGLNPSTRNLMLENLVSCYIVYFISIFFLLLLMLVRVCVQGRQVGIKHVCLRACLIVTSVLVVIISEKTAKPGYVCLVRGFLKRMQNEADIPAIRTWLKSTHRNKQDIYGVDKSEWPDAIKKLSPQYVFVEVSDNNEMQVRMEWGGALMGHWGLSIGPPTTQIPMSEFERPDEHRLQLAPGAHVWYGK